MKKFTICICVLLIVIMIFPFSALAAEDSALRASDYFMEDSCYLYHTTGTDFDVCFDVSGVGMMDEIGANTVKVQRSSDGVNWTTVETRKKADYADMIDYDTSCHSYFFTFSGEEGYSYRAYVQFYAKKGSGSATLGRYSYSIDL